MVVKKILIVKLGAIGDVLRTTSLLPGLKKKYRRAKIDWLTASSAKDVLLHNPLINRIYLWEQRKNLGLYDLVISLEDDLAACQLVTSLRAKEVVGAFARGGKQAYTSSGWFDMSLISKYGLTRANELKKENTKTYQEQMAELLGIKVSPYVFKLTPAEIKAGHQLGFKKSELVVGVNTAAGKRWPQKSWGVGQTIELIKKIKNELGVRSFILGGKDEEERNKQISRETGMPRSGVHSLREFAALINCCDVLLTSDSLALHFGLALKKRVVAFFGPTSAAEIELYGLGEKVTPPFDCLACYKKSCHLKPTCMEALTVDDVFSAVMRQLPLA